MQHQILTSAVSRVLYLFMFEANTDCDPRAAWRADVLKELVEAGMDMVRDMRGVAAVADGPDMSLRFGRLAKAVRMTLALDARLCDEAGVAAEERVKARRAEHNTRILDRKIAVHNAVRSCIEMDVAEGEQRRGMFPDELAQEIDHDDLLEEDYLTKPVSEIVAMICELLDVAVDFNTFRFEDWAKEELSTRPPGSAFAKGVPPPLDRQAWRNRPPHPGGELFASTKESPFEHSGWT